jgi:elongation factor Ts
MANISAADVKALREKTGAAMMECKNALVETDGDFAKAEKILKEKGLAAVEKRSGRATNAGKIIIKIKDEGANGSTAVLVETVAETDFVARNPEFIKMSETIADIALEKGYTSVNDELNNMVLELAAKIRENMKLSRIRMIKAGPDEYLSSYIHHDGTIGVVVKTKADKGGIFANEDVKEFAFSLALNVAAYNPIAIDQSKIDPAWLKEQEDIFRKQMELDEGMKGKPANVLEKILKGKVSKLVEENCIMDQVYVNDDKINVAKAMEDAGKRFGAKFSIEEFVYFRTGE